MMTKEIEEQSRNLFRFDLVTKILFLVSCLLLGVNIITVFSIPEGVTDYDDGLSSYVNNNITTRNLSLAINVDINETFLENLNNEGYYFTLHIKGDQYVDQISYPIGILLEGDIITVPIISNSTNFDDGEQDLRVDIWVNEYKNKYETVNFNEGDKFKEVDLTDRIEYVIADMNREADEEHE